MNRELLRIKERLDLEMAERNHADEISYDKPDPILVAHRYRNEWSALICALFGYGRADSIVRFLDTLDMRLLEQNEAQIRTSLSQHYYRFQSSEDVIQFFISLRRLKENHSLQSLFKNGYNSQNNVITGVNSILHELYNINQYESRGYRFLIGSAVEKPKGSSTMKRWMMFLRWMVRSDEIDMGLWSDVSSSDLIIPLDTHTFNVSKKLGLLKRKTYDLEASCELTETLKLFDPDDPVKYDFALYRMGQERMV
ncbi:MAG: TIGR02757 family protein [Campylobacterota bacterium]|nr:TIGR02757 family protein [Campylobacterota bacterium]